MLQHILDCSERVERRNVCIGVVEGSACCVILSAISRIMEEVS